VNFESVDMHTEKELLKKWLPLDCVCVCICMCEYASMTSFTLAP